MKAFYKLFYYISILLTCVLAGFTIAGNFAVNASAANSNLLPFIGLMLPMLLLTNVVVAIYWGVRWRYWLFIPLIAIFCNWGYLNRVIQTPFSDSASQPKITVNNFTPGILTIATYNVDSFHREESGFTSKFIANFMKSTYADILCFQEFGINTEFPIDSLEHVFAEWPYHYIPISPTGKSLLQLAVFSRYPISNEHLIVYPESNNCSLWCDINFNGQTIRLFNNHLQTTEVNRNKRKIAKELQKENNESVERAAFILAKGLQENFAKRDAQADILNQQISTSPHPTIVCGDFNSIPSSYTYHRVKGDKLNDGFQTCGHGYMYTFHHFKHLLRIDYVLHSPELKGVDYFSPDLVYSDHNPVVMRVKL